MCRSCVRRWRTGAVRPVNSSGWAAEKWPTCRPTLRWGSQSHFGTDPDPPIHASYCWIRIGSGSCYCCHWPSRRQQKNNFILKVHLHSYSGGVLSPSVADPYSFWYGSGSSISGGILIRIQGVDDQKLTNNLQLSRKNILHFIAWNFLTFFYFCGSFLPSWFRIRISDPDIWIHWPDWIRIQSGSGSETLLSPNHFFWSLKSLHFEKVLQLRANLCESLRSFFCC